MFHDHSIGTLGLPVMDFFAEVRRLTITALFADDRLMDQIVLKGGNALNLVYGLSTRTSVDIDFSLAGDFDDFEETKQRIFRVLRDRFDSAGYVVFDERFDAKPRLDGPDERPWWGGYELRFKLLSKERYQALKGNLIKMQIDAIPIGPDQMRTFSVDFSKHEYTEGKQECEFDDYAIYVYTPAMLAIEKLRAICQQMDAYPLKGGRRPRARDFYDIHAVLSKEGLDLSSTTNIEVIQHIFAAKQVPLSLLGRIREQREFHRPDWKTVEDAVSGRIEPFDYYFEFVLSEVDRLQALWKE